jgi:phosphoserine phosphatase RsbU/P
MSTLPAAQGACLERLLGLTDYMGVGGPAEAFRALHHYIAPSVPGCGCLLLNTAPGASGTAWVDGYIDAGGVEVVSGREGRRRGERRWQFHDELAAAVMREGGIGWLFPDEAVRSTPLGQLMGRPRAILVAMLNAWLDSRYWLVFPTERPGALAALDQDLLYTELRLAFALVGGGFLGASVVAHERTIDSLADIQRALQPDCPEVRGMSHAIHWQPADTAAGDYFDLMRMSHSYADFTDTGVDAWGAVVADVTGHGAAAAMEAVQLDAILRTYRNDEPPGGPAGALTYANRFFFSRRARSRFITALAVSGRPDRGELIYVNAGHLPPLRRRGATVSVVGSNEEADIPLGVERDHRWANHSTTLETGDLLVLYTDGVTEARNASGQMFGIAGISRALGAAQPQPAAALDAIRDALFEHQGGVIGADDQTLLVVRQGP